MTNKLNYRNAMFYSNYCGDRWKLYNQWVPEKVEHPNGSKKLDKLSAQIEEHKRKCSICTDADNYNGDK
jgi:hypothetical protein